MPSYQSPKLPNCDTENEVLNKIGRSAPRTTESVLLSGARFLSAEFPDPATSSVAVYFDAGSSREQPGQFGMLHFFEHLPPASFRISSGGKVISRLAAERMWDVRIDITQSRIGFGFSAPSFDIKEALTVLGVILGNSTEAFRSVFDVEKGRIINEIDGYAKNAQRVVADSIAALTMPGTGFAHPVTGTRDEVAAYSFEQVLAMGRRFLHPGRATCVVSGSSDGALLARQAFEEMTFPGVSSKLEVPPLAPTTRLLDQPREQRSICPYVPGVTIRAMLDGIPVSQSDTSAALNIVTRYLSAVLNTHLSHERGLSYGGIVYTRSYPDVGFIDMDFNVSPQHLREARDILTATVREIPSLITPNLLAETYTAALHSSFRAIDIPNALPSLDTLATYPSLRPRPAVEGLKQLRNLSPEFVREVAERYLRAEDLRFVYFGSDEVLSKALGG